MTSRVQYLGRTWRTIQASDRRLLAGVHLALVRGRVICVGLDLRSFEEDHEGALKPMNAEWIEITSPLVRGVKTAQLIEEVLAEKRAALAMLLEGMQDVGQVDDAQFVALL